MHPKVENQGFRTEMEREKFFCMVYKSSKESDMSLLPGDLAGIMVVLLGKQRIHSGNRGCLLVLDIQVEIRHSSGASEAAASW